MRKVFIFLTLAIMATVWNAIVAQTNYGFSINGTAITSANYQSIGSIEGVTGSVTYDPVTTTLTLNNATIINNEATGAPIVNKANPQLVIKLVGHSTIRRNNGDTYENVGIWLEANLRITGKGVLDIINTSDRVAGIRADENNSTLTIDGGCWVRIKTINYHCIAGGYAAEGELYRYLSLIVDNARLDLESTRTHTYTQDGVVNYLKDITLKGGVVYEDNSPDDVKLDEEGKLMYYDQYEDEWYAPKSTYLSKPSYKMDLAGKRIDPISINYVPAIPGVTGGNLTYNASTQNLTLNNLKVDDNRVTDGSCALAIYQEGVTVTLTGNNTIKGQTKHYVVYLQKNSTIKGPGSLKIDAPQGGGIYPVVYSDNGTFTIKDGATVEINAKKYGIQGYTSTGCSITLAVNNATLKSTGREEGSIIGINALTGNCRITQPSGASFSPSNKAVIDNTTGAVIKTQVVITKSTGLSETSQGAIATYPNPVVDMLYINETEEVRSIEVYNAHGSKVASVTGAKQIDLRLLPAGVYVVRISTDKGVDTQRIVKK